MAGSVGFVGLGNMGGPMALNLVKVGFELVVHDINAARLEPLVAVGATVETSPEAVAARATARSAWSRPPPRPKP
jgi:3-hydroxyisobutyrate dehydrogenase-like beta-hydroxyacid dehydrogenase